MLRISINVVSEQVFVISSIELYPLTEYNGMGRVQRCISKLSN
jgi:hypothetical protein